MTSAPKFLFYVPSVNLDALSGDLLSVPSPRLVYFRNTPLSIIVIVFFEGSIENSCLYVCPSTAQALCPQEQATIWAANPPYAYGSLFICKTTLAQASSEFNYPATVDTAGHSTRLCLPVEQAVKTFGKQLFHETAIDECPSLTVENGLYVCIYGEAACVVFQRAQALLNEL